MVPRQDDSLPEMVEASEIPPPPPPPLASPSHSMATGSFSVHGSVRTLVESPKKTCSIKSSFSEETLEQEEEVLKSPNKRGSSWMTLLKESSERIVSPVVFRRLKSSFLRVADLQMEETLSAGGSSDMFDVDSEQSYPNFHHISVDPPPGVTEDPHERWVALDDGAGRHAPIAPFAIRALARVALSSTFDESMWTPDAKTDKLLKCNKGIWHDCVWNQNGCITVPNGIDQSQVLVWMGTFQHNHYGSDLPAIRAAGLIDMSPNDLLDLLVDSSRVQEYNKLSLGRQDLLLLQQTMDKEGPFGGSTKVILSESKPPMLRKTMQFTSILHARELEDASGYQIVTRAVTHPQDKKKKDVLQSEILMGVNLIKRIEDNPHQCLMITVNHIRSPMVPTMIAKRLGQQAAINFIHDLRLC